MTAARHVGRHGVRDATIILLMFRHGLRSAELVALKWSSVDFKNGYLAIHRVKADADASSAAQAKGLPVVRCDRTNVCEADQNPSGSRRRTARMRCTLRCVFSLR